MAHLIARLAPIVAELTAEEAGIVLAVLLLASVAAVLVGLAVYLISQS
jgi:hypothetical protein